MCDLCSWSYLEKLDEVLEVCWSFPISIVLRIFSLFLPYFCTFIRCDLNICLSHFGVKDAGWGAVFDGFLRIYCFNEDYSGFNGEL